MPKSKAPAKPVCTSVEITSRAFGPLAGSTGRVAEGLAQSLQRAGHAVVVTPAPTPFYGEFANDTADSIRARLSFERPDLWKRENGVMNFGVLEHPANGFPAQWEQGFNNVDVILCPSRWAVEGLEAFGGDINRATPMAFKYGIAEHEFPFERRTRKRAFRAIVSDTNVGATISNADAAVVAFKAAFGDREDVELVIRTANPLRHVDSRGARVRYEFGPRTPQELARLYHSCDVMLYTRSASAFGTTALEAIASGLPVIHSGETAMRDFADLGIVVDSRTVPAADGFGQWAEINVEALAAALRDFEQHYDAAMDEAEIDAMEVRERYAWDSDALVRLIR